MSDNMIRVTPQSWRRQRFAKWGVGQDPKVYTVSQDTFELTPDQFTRAPEEILIGALVDGHRYVSPHDEQRPPEAPVTEEREAVPGEILPELPESAYGPDVVPLTPPDFAPLDDAPAGDEDSDSSDPDTERTPGGSALPEPEPGEASAPAEEFSINPCPGCEREFTTGRGRDTHYRMVHAESRS